MKNLQVLTPHQNCIYNCPFCIAKSHNHLNNFENNYEKNYKLWKMRSQKAGSLEG